jgi:hypothetical protein
VPVSQTLCPASQTRKMRLAVDADQLSVGRGGHGTPPTGSFRIVSTLPACWIEDCQARGVAF